MKKKSLGVKGQVGPVSYKTPTVLLIRYCTTHALLTPGVSFVRELSVLLQFTDSDYPFDIFKFFIHMMIIFLVFCVVFFVLFNFVLCFVHNVPVSLDCLFLITASILGSIYLLIANLESR
jgi:hypothetical protein